MSNNTFFITSMLIVVVIWVLLRKWDNFKKKNKHDERGRYVIGKVSAILFELSFIDIGALTVLHLSTRNDFIFLLGVLLVLVIKAMIMIYFLNKFDKMTQ